VPTRAMLTHPSGVGIDALLSVLWEAHGTDLLLTAGMAPQIRVQGELSGVRDHGVLTPNDVGAPPLPCAWTSGPVRSAHRQCPLARSRPRTRCQ
jgi:hypothetical protein